MSRAGFTRGQAQAEQTSLMAGKRRLARRLRGASVVVIALVALVVTLAAPARTDCGGGAGPGRTQPTCSGIALGWLTSAGVSAPYPQVSGGGGSGPSGVAPPPLAPWPPDDPWIAPPGRGAFRMPPQGDYYWWAYGQCTWWAQWTRRDENLQGMGDAWEWPTGAHSRSYRVGANPARGATATFAPWVQGASGQGHLAHVEEVYPDGWFLISEMNFDWNGGGWGRVDYRYAHTGEGVLFIY